MKTNSEIAFTSGNQVRQYIYIDEVVDIIFKANFTNVTSGVYNISGAETFSVKQLVSSLFKLFAKQLPDNVFGKTERTDSGMLNLQLNGKKFQQAINYVPGIKLIDVYDRY